ncbi:hypothetical protein [Paenibacillus illinoisensis]|uniref:hypothetical protein n=1 Tax=Paenibacillus illinoisensis TaxID=59845 RepID=UPI000FDA203D|nr:hypothetical protein [Paenibacillus illinoisensis]
MRFLFLLLLIIVPLVMVFLALRSRTFIKLFHALALICFYSAATVIAGDVYATNAHMTTFTTEIHHFLLNGWFLYPSAYLGAYIPFLLWISLFSKKNNG